MAPSRPRAPAIVSTPPSTSHAPGCAPASPLRSATILIPTASSRWLWRRGLPRISFCACLGVCRQSLVERGRSGESVTRVWGEGAAARELFELPDWMRIAQSLITARLIYFSGITLSLYSNNGLGRLFAALEVARQQGVKVAFDGNFRPIGWKGNVARARTVFMEALKRVDIALPTFDDEAVLWGDPSPESTVARLQAFGVGEIVVKNGPNSALVATSGAMEFVPVPEVLVPVDPTAAGDGFNAGYLAARLSGSGRTPAAGAAHRLAANIISHPGALLPRGAVATH